MVKYHRYLRSHNWHLRVIRKLAMNGGPTDFQKLWMLHYEKTAPSIKFRCEGCGGMFARRDVEIHHVTYVRIYYERPNDLEVLCGKCHKARHGITEQAAPVAFAATPDF